MNTYSCSLSHVGKCNDPDDVDDYTVCTVQSSVLLKKMPQVLDYFRDFAPKVLWCVIDTCKKKRVYFWGIEASDSFPSFHFDAWLNKILYVWGWQFKELRCYSSLKLQSSVFWHLMESWAVKLSSGSKSTAQFTVWPWINSTLLKKTLKRCHGYLYSICAIAVRADAGDPAKSAVWLSRKWVISDYYSLVYLRKNINC